MPNIYIVARKLSDNRQSVWAFSRITIMFVNFPISLFFFVLFFFVESAWMTDASVSIQMISGSLQTMSQPNAVLMS